jgi:DNA-binding HxlR family transcriptional regulator
MAAKRRYNDGCGTAHALELVGERWALLILRELMLGPKRFSDLRDDLPGISPNVLTQRLEELEGAFILGRRKLPPPSGASVYELTEWGAEIEPVIRDIGRWAARSPAMRPGPMSVNSLILSLRTMFNATSAKGMKATVELRIGEQKFMARIAGSKIAVEPGAARKPDAIVTGDQNDMAAVIYGGRKLSDAVDAGQLTVDGDRELFQRFVTLFPLPATATTEHRR